MNEKPQLVFIHCADLHLDSPFEGLHQIDSHIASVLRDATFQAFEKVIDFTIAENCDFLLISGDVYDEADRSLRAKLRFRDQLQRAMEAGIPCFVAHGNHDPLSGWEAEISLPDGVTRFGGEKVELIPFREGKDDRAHIYGISFPVREVRENLAKRFRRESNSVFSIAVLHCNLGGNTEYDNYA
ncbi:MAG: DNA repair exonuclease, partial [Atribacterota bacterium]